LPETASLFSNEFFSGRPFQQIASPLLKDRSNGFLNGLVQVFWRKKIEAVDRMLDWDNTQPLPDDMLVKIDIASMARSLEVRSPFLDHELVEFCASLPALWKVNNRQGKLILRDIVGQDLPPEVLNAPKRGFSVPLADWFRSGARQQVNDGVFPLHPSLTPFINENVPRDLLAEHQSGKANHAMRLWALWVLNEWARAFLKHQS
jgi:asparagine synthase (glutamine-hydrolysing)